VGVSLDGGSGTDAYDVFSFGIINATINALNPDTMPDGGHIGRVGAWGQIGGHFEAADTIHEVRSGDAVTATLIAPNLPTLIQFDSTITTDHPYPDTPASVIGQVLADAAAEYALVLSTKTQVASDIVQLLADFATDKAAEAATLAAAIAQVTADIDDAFAQAVDALSTDIEEGNALLDAARNSAAAELTTLAASVDASQTAIAGERDQVAQERQTAYTNAVQFSADVHAAMAASDADVAAAVAAVNDATLQAREQHRQAWKDRRPQILAATKDGWWIPVPPPPPKSIENVPKTPKFYLGMLVAAVLAEDMPNLAQAAAQERWQRAVAAVHAYESMAAFVPVLGFLLDLGRLVSGEDLFMGRELSGSERFWAGVGVVSGAAGGVVASGLSSGSRGATRLAGKADEIIDCGTDASGAMRRAAHGCFVAGTEVYCAGETSQAWLTNQVWLVTAAGLFAAGPIAFGVLQRRKRRRREVEDPAQTVDEVFAEHAVVDEWLHSTDGTGNPEIDAESIETLCDRLFNGDQWTDADAMTVAMHSSSATTESAGRLSPSRRAPAGEGFADPKRTARSFPHAAARNDRIRAALADDTIVVVDEPEPEVNRHPRPVASVRSRELRKRSKKCSFVGLALLTGALLLSAFCLHKGLSSSRVTTKPIEEIQVSDRVVGANPLREDAEADAAIPDASSWRQAKLHLTGDDGHSVEIDLLRPSGWFQEMGAEEGATIVLDLPELGAVGEAEVLYLGPCPDIRPGPGNLVTATFKHSSAETVNLYVASGEPIGTTKNHPIWSENRQCFVRVDDLRLGERVRTSCGVAETVAMEERPGRQVVYNIEVQGQHVYQVGGLGVLVHNKAMKLAKGVPHGPLKPNVLTKADSILDVAGITYHPTKFLKKARKHIDQMRKRHPGTVTPIPAIRKDQAGAVSMIQDIINKRVAQGGGTIRPPGGSFPNTVEYVDGNVSYIFSQNGDFVTILKN